MRLLSDSSLTRCCICFCFLQYDDFWSKQTIHSLGRAFAPMHFHLIDFLCNSFAFLFYSVSSVDLFGLDFSLVPSHISLSIYVFVFMVNGLQRTLYTFQLLTKQKFNRIFPLGRFSSYFFIGIYVDCVQSTKWILVNGFIGSGWYLFDGCGKNIGIVMGDLATPVI